MEKDGDNKSNNDDDVVDNGSTEDSDIQKGIVHLHWTPTGGENQRPCFCDPILAFSIKKVKITPETMAALYGITPHSRIEGFVFDKTFVVRERETQTVVPLSNASSSASASADDEEIAAAVDPFWNLEAGNYYLVDVVEDEFGTTADADDDEDSADVVVVVPMNQIYQLLPSATEDEKDDDLHGLSKAFYNKIWHDDTVSPKEFRDKFFSKFSTAKIQAFRQYCWLQIVFGGPSLGQVPSIVYQRMMAKHTNSRMTFEHAVTWLKIMKLTLLEQFPSTNDSKLRRNMGLYWLHFYAYFTYSDAERREFRKLIL